jgi:hypothetical protein
MKSVGLIPSEYSTGERRRQGSSTKAGNTHARRALVEGAWADRYPAKVSRHLQLRLEQQPKAIQDISWKAQVRLCKRYRRLLARGKHANQVVVAIARELVGFMWAIANRVTFTPRPIDSCDGTHHCDGIQLRGFRRALEETQPRCGVTLDSVTRPAGILMPRVRQAPDGRKSGGHEPTDISRINRRIDWLRLFSCTRQHYHHADLKKLWLTLDIGSHINRDRGGTSRFPPSHTTGRTGHVSGGSAEYVNDASAGGGVGRTTGQRTVLEEQSPALDCGLGATVREPTCTCSRRGLDSPRASAGPGTCVAPIASTHSGGGAAGPRSPAP